MEVSYRTKNRGRRCEDASGGWSDARSGTKECGKPLEAGKGSEMDSPLEPPKEQAFDFHCARPILDSDLQNSAIDSLPCMCDEML